MASFLARGTAIPGKGYDPAQEDRFSADLVGVDPEAGRLPPRAVADGKAAEGHQG